MSKLLEELESAAQLLESAELETTIREGRATVNWGGLYSVMGAIQAGRGRKGLYVIYRNGRVVDSGKADVQDLGTRVAQHFEYPQRHTEELNNYRVRLGVIRRASAVNLAEGVTTRSLAKRGFIPPTRTSLFTGREVRVPNTAPFRAGPEVFALPISDECQRDCAPSRNDVVRGRCRASAEARFSSFCHRPYSRRGNLRTNSSASAMNLKVQSHSSPESLLSPASEIRKATRS